jgi:uncharacterized protein YdgA (DUF945 family)
VKKIVAVVVILVLAGVALWGGTTYWFGVKAEEQYRALLQQTSQWPSLKFVNESYHRGFCRSQARTVMELQLSLGPAGETQSLKIPLAQDITHGPFPLGNLPDGQSPLKPVIAIVETRLAPGTELQDRLAEIWKQVPELASLRDCTVIYLDGRGEERLVLPAFQRTFGEEQAIAVTWKGLFFQTDFAADLKAFSGSLSIPGSDVRGKELELHLGEVKSTFTSQEGISGLWLGDATFSLAGFEFTSGPETGAPSMALRDFKVSATSKASGDSISSAVTIRTEQLTLNGTQYGPGVFDVEFRNLDAPSLAKLQQALREEQGQPRPQSEEEAQLKTLAKYMEILPGLLKKSPEIEIRQFDLKTSLGDFTGKAKIAFDGTKAGAIQNLMALTTALTAQVDVKIAEGLLRSGLSGVLKGDVIAEWEELEEGAPDEEAVAEIVAARVDEQLATLTAQNLLVKEDGTYTSSARYEGGQIILNGRPLSLQELAQ